MRMGMIPDQDKDLLRGKFDGEMEGQVTLVAFTRKAAGLDQPGLECEFCGETEQLIREVGDLSNKINVESHEYSPDEPTARNLGIDKLPALVITNDVGNGVRYFGIPGGFEFSSLVEDIVDVSRNSTDLSQEAKDKVRGVDGAVHIQVFVAPTCPYCPAAVRTAHQMAIENPKRIRADAIEVSEFPHLVSRYDIGAVPTVVINDKVQFEGVLGDAEFAERVVEAVR